MNELNLGEAEVFEGGFFRQIGKTIPCASCRHMRPYCVLRHTAMK